MLMMKENTHSFIQMQKKPHSIEQITNKIYKRTQNEIVTSGGKTINEMDNKIA